MGLRVFLVESARAVDGGYVGAVVFCRVRGLGGWSSGLSFLLGGFLVCWVALSPGWFSWVSFSFLSWLVASGGLGWLVSSLGLFFAVCLNRL